jgi:hypothetical protein
MSETQHDHTFGSKPHTIRWLVYRAAWETETMPAALAATRGKQFARVKTDLGNLVPVVQQHQTHTVNIGGGGARKCSVTWFGSLFIFAQ